MSEGVEVWWKPTLIETVRYALYSPDPSTQNGAVIVRGNNVLKDTFAVNEFPRGVHYLDERWERPLKYEIIEHAERGAIYKAAKHGYETDGCTLVSPWAACSDCARAIICAGITDLVTLAPKVSDTNERWDASIATAMTMLSEADVKVHFIEGPLDCGIVLRRNGEKFIP